MCNVLAGIKRCFLEANNVRIMGTRIKMLKEVQST